MSNNGISVFWGATHLTPHARLVGLFLGDHTQYGRFRIDRDAFSEQCGMSDYEVAIALTELGEKLLAVWSVQTDDQGITLLIGELPDLSHEFINPSPPSKPSKRRLAVLLKTGGRCFYCDCDNSDELQLDHMMPSSRGGSNSVDNLIPACFRCNGEKSNMTVEEYRIFLAEERGVSSELVPFYPDRQRKTAGSK